MGVSKAADKSKNKMSEPVLLLEHHYLYGIGLSLCSVRAYKHFGEDEVLLQLIDD